MESTVKKVRKTAIIIGCIAILAFMANGVASVMMSLDFMRGFHELSLHAPPTPDMNIALAQAIVAPLATFLFQSCFALTVILIALRIDPAKVVPVFDSEDGCDEDEPQ